MEILSLVFKHKNETDVVTTLNASVDAASVSFMGQRLLTNVSQ